MWVLLSNSLLSEPASVNFCLSVNLIWRVRPGVILVWRTDFKMEQLCKERERRLLDSSFVGVQKESDGGELQCRRGRNQHSRSSDLNIAVVGTLCIVVTFMTESLLYTKLPSMLLDQCDEYCVHHVSFMIQRYFAIGTPIFFADLFVCTTHADSIAHNRNPFQTPTCKEPSAMF